MTPSSCVTVRCTGNSLPAGTLAWKGRDRSVSVVPGCRATQITLRRERAHSTASVRVNMFCAAFAAR